MKGFLLLLLCFLTASGAQAQTALVPALDANTLELARRVFLPVFGFYLLCTFVLAIVRLILNYLLKRQIVAAAVSESIVERLLPGPEHEQNKVVKWFLLLLSSGLGLLICTRYLPLGLHSLIILLFSTSLGFLAYHVFLSRQKK